MKKFFLVLVSFFLAACTTSSVLPKISQPLPQARWQADGVLGYREGERGFSAGYIWQNQPESYHIQLIGPLGAWRAHLSGDPHQTVLAMSNGQRFRASNPETLMQENLGWSVPVENLRYWFLGLPNPYLKGLVSRRNDGEVTAIQQAGWVIEYLSYQNTHPSRILLTQGNKKITVVVEHFKG